MMHPAATHLTIHAAIVLLFGLALGAPYAKAINNEAPAQVVNSWRVAHQSLPIAATLMLAIAGVMSQFAVATWVLWMLSALWIASTYAFCISMPLAAITRHRGLTADGVGLQRLVYWGNVAGAWLSVAAAITLLYAAIYSIVG